MPARKKRPLSASDNIQWSDFAIRLHDVLDTIVDEAGQICKVWARQGAGSEVPLAQLFMTKDPHEIIVNMYQWDMQNEIREDEPDVFLLKRSCRAFQSRVGVPHTLATVDVDKGLKPTIFELHLLLEEQGWVFKSHSNISLQALKRTPITAEPLHFE